MRVPKVRSIFIGLCAKGPNTPRLRRIPISPGSAMFFIELRSPSDLAIHMPFSSWCWGSSGGWVGDGFGMCLVRVSPCFSTLLSPCLFHWPRQLSTAYTVSSLLASPSGYWDLGHENRPRLFSLGFASANSFAHPPLPSFSFTYKYIQIDIFLIFLYFYTLSTNYLLICIL